jgi:hypothetical protein
MQTEFVFDGRGGFENAQIFSADGNVRARSKEGVACCSGGSTDQAMVAEDSAEERGGRLKSRKSPTDREGAGKNVPMKLSGTS